MRPLHTLTRAWLAGLGAACLALAVGATPAGAAEKLNKEDFQKFVNCPVEVAKACVYGETLSGEFKMGSKQVPITTPVILQGGLAYLGLSTLPLLAPRFGAPPLSDSAQTIPGGLTGLSEQLGGPVVATAELAGPLSNLLMTPAVLANGYAPAVQLPIKVHLQNELLGEDCYIGSDAEPIFLHLTDGKTVPPEGAEPVSGKVGTLEDRDKGRIVAFSDNTLVDNAFPVPAATGCGTSSLLEPIVTGLVNLDAGLPSPAGKNLAVLNGNFYSTTSTWVEKYVKIKKPKKEETK